jgi:hypothetical protein
MLGGCKIGTPHGAVFTLSTRTPLVYFMWPWLTLATLMIFRASMRRARVRTVHVLRCALYSCDAAVWLVPLTAYLVSEHGSRLVGGRYDALFSPYYGSPLLLVPLLPAAYTAYRLSAAYALYLRFDHPVATAVASQLIVMLAVLAVI